MKKNHSLYRGCKHHIQLTKIVAKAWQTTVILLRMLLSALLQLPREGNLSLSPPLILVNQPNAHINSRPYQLSPSFKSFPLPTKRCSVLILYIGNAKNFIWTIPVFFPIAVLFECLQNILKTLIQNVTLNIL